MLIINGVGEAYWETGTEGVLWAIEDPDPKKVAYDQLYILQNGDDLTIFDRDDQNIVRWHGTVDLEYQSHQEHAPANPDYVGQAIYNHWVHGLQRDLDAETWARYFFERHPMRLQRRAGWEAFHYEGLSFWKGTLDKFNKRPDVALLRVNHALAHAHGKPRYMYHLERGAVMKLTAEDLRGLRDACDAILAELLAGDGQT